MNLAERLLGTTGNAWAPATPHVRRPALADYTPTAPLVVPSPVGSDAYHPDVVDAGSGWNGRRYWMGMTPYLNDDDDTENPCILASVDGTTWEVPTGGSNPITPLAGDYHSDTDLVLVRDEGLLYCFYRTIGGLTGGMRYRTSADGVHWAPEVVFEIDGAAISQLSPAYVRVSSTQWRVWWIDLSDRTLRTATAPSPSGPWSEPITCQIDVPAGATMWHVDVIKSGRAYFALVYCDSVPTIGNGIIGGVSADGITWGESTDWLMKPNETFSPLYRATLQPAPGGFAAWVGATTASGHRIGRTFIPAAEFA